MVCARYGKGSPFTLRQQTTFGANLMFSLCSLQVITAENILLQLAISLLIINMLIVLAKKSPFINAKYHYFAAPACVEPFGSWSHSQASANPGRFPSRPRGRSAASRPAAAGSVGRVSDPVDLAGAVAVVVPGPLPLAMVRRRMESAFGG